MNRVTAILLLTLLMLSSCQENADENTSSSKKTTEKIKPERSEFESKMFEDYNIKANVFLADYVETSNKEFLDSSLFYYKKANSQNPIDVLPIIYCGVLNEKLGESKEATKFYTKAKDQAKRNIENPKKLLKYEYETEDIKEVSELFDVSEKQIIADLKDHQMLFLLSTKILLKESTATDIQELKSLASKSKNLSLSQFQNINNREDLILNLLGEQ